MSEYQFNPSVEVWKAIPGFPGYEVSDLGRIRSFWKAVSHIGVCFSTPQKIKKVFWDRNGRGYILFKTKRMAVHRCVLLAFIGPCPKGYQCRHLDGNPQNNQLDNLRWGTPQDNADDRQKHGNTARGEKAGGAKLNPDAVSQIRHLYANGDFNQYDLAKLFNVSRPTITAIMTRRNWKHI